MGANTDSSALDALVRRSNRLGSDRSVCNWGGGNTSAKTTLNDHMERATRVLWVKASGSDLATASRRSFTGLRLDEVTPLLTRSRMADADMVSYIARCYFEPNRPRPSIETLLHAFLSAVEIDHTHADATNYFACAVDGERLAREVFGDELVWIPYVRPGFALSKEVALAVSANPRARLVILAKHGLITWGESEEECSRNTADVITRARTFVEQRMASSPIFGGSRCQVTSLEQRRTLMARILPFLRGLVSLEKPCILHYDHTQAVLEFVSSMDAPRLAAVGAACPDHLIHTRPWPVMVNWMPGDGLEALKDALQQGIKIFVAQYHGYLEEQASQDLDPDSANPVYRETGAAVDLAPRVILIPGVGMVTTGKDAFFADVSAQLYHRAIAVMAGAEACGGFIALTDAESYAVEYWPLEQYKLRLAPPEKEFAGQVVLVTGAAGGIGSAVCNRLARDGAHIVATDIDEESVHILVNEIGERYGAGRAISLRMDVTDEESVHRAFEDAALQYGGIDIIVNNAGLASSAPVTDTSLAEWHRNMEVLSTGYFLVAREGFRLLQEQGRGGCMVFVVSKNAVVAGKNTSAYSAAKASELHLARCLAEEGGPLKIRVNVVNPDAVLAGSRIWAGMWRQERADTYGIQPDELEEHYRTRTLLGLNVHPMHVAEAVAFFASEARSSRSTANFLNVDGGVSAAFPR